ncbi:hypothetical protein LMH87_004460 [Akanthomyces muscarius]|uniref:Uncharacterized protein n=2 Tax=Akanthomyces TaxID=150366 RepID=A0A162KND6_CORDF|nr:hypothetical protein LMH87_004460 [Akanthomyces muscarius]KAJ4145614.1 hypothetical protein LMH87_004460 [Akanthomyces muscarius]OAA77508.1 hypothetical protein LEL_04331 [Akanthomyces lecanii RCEF 1005]
MAFKDTQSVEVSIPLPKSLDTRIFIRVATLDKAVMVSLTTASQEETGATTPMGSMVYALPDRFNPQQPLATTIFTTEATLEFTTRTARILARRANRPVYVTNSMSFVNAGMGGTVEEEMEALKNVIDIVSDQLKKEGLLAGAEVNGVS